MILCGGKGTRLREVTELLPKPMVPIGEHPIVWHIMKCFAAFGCRRFILCLGYMKEAFINFFMSYHALRSDITITLGHQNRIVFHGDVPESDWEVTLADTGIETMTGGRVAIASKYLTREDDVFFLTYGDGVADIDVKALLAAHKKNGGMITVSAVHPSARFGEMMIEGNRIVRFDEKPTVSTKYINGGYMVIEKAFLDKYISTTPDLVLEQAPMHNAAKDNNMTVYKHEGFWQCMDTPREYTLLNALWKSGNAPWIRFWKQK